MVIFIPYCASTMTNEKVMFQGLGDMSYDDFSKEPVKVMNFRMVKTENVRRKKLA